MYQHGIGLSRYGNDIKYHNQIKEAVNESILELSKKEGTLYRKKFSSSGSTETYNIEKYENGKIENISIPKNIIPSELDRKDIIFKYKNDGTIEIKNDLKEKIIEIACKKISELKEKEQQRNDDYKKENHIYDAIEDDGYVFLKDLTEDRGFVIEDIDFTVDDYQGEGKYQVINGKYEKIS